MQGDQIRIVLLPIAASGVMTAAAGRHGVVRRLLA